MNTYSFKENIIKANLENLKENNISWTNGS